VEKLREQNFSPRVVSSGEAGKYRGIEQEIEKAAGLVRKLHPKTE
jgi:hypothetical protein